MTENKKETVQNEQFKIDMFKFKWNQIEQQSVIDINKYYWNLTN